MTRIEAVLSDAQLAHVLADLTAAASTRDSALLIHEFVQQQILMAGDDSTDLIRQIVDRVQEELIAQVLEQCSGVQVRAAARLGIDRNSLRKKLCAQKAIAASATQTPV